MTCQSISGDPVASSVTIGHVGLAEAGNLGDDLILIAVVRAISAALPGARVRFLSHGFPLNWESVQERLRLNVDLQQVHAGRGVGQMVRAPRLLDGCSAVVFGGGGLLQTSHHPLRPYHWLRFLGAGKRHPPAIAVGLGLGPLSEKWLERLGRGPRYFEQCWVRDDASRSLARRLGWDARLCSDFVDSEFLDALGLPPGSAPKDGPLGIALRAWPGLDAELVAQHIERVAAGRGIERITFFVLESKHGRGPDVDFTHAVSDCVKLPTSVWVYDSQNLFEILDRMMECSAAISMKLHAGVLWEYAGAVIYPIIYAPKVAALFRLPYRGLEVLEESVQADVLREAGSVPSAHRVVGEWLKIARPPGATQAAMDWRSLLVLGIRSDLIRVGKVFKARSRGRKKSLGGSS